MISVLEAKKFLDQTAHEIAAHVMSENVSLTDSFGRVLTLPVVAPVNSPLFDNSAMDGFAIRFSDTLKATDDNPVTLKMIGEIRAGDSLSFPSPLVGEGLGEGPSCIRIMTGAPIPSGCDAVVMKEKVIERDENISLLQPVPLGNNIRRCGEDIKKGEVALDRGAKIEAGTIGFLASLGVSEVSVAKQPLVSILATGSELVGRIEDLGPGKIMDSNSLMLKALLQQSGFDCQRSEKIKDDPALIHQALKTLLSESDILILTGGVSVGDYDYTKSILADLGVETLFWKVNQKPGKPLYVGRLGSKIIFGLPGNPYAAFVCFHVYILPFLQKMMGETQGVSFKLPLAIDWNKKEERTHFLKGKKIVEDDILMVRPLIGQGSHELRALTESDVLIYLADGARSYHRGDLVEVLCL